MSILSLPRPLVSGQATVASLSPATGRTAAITRATTATYVDANGVVRSVATNVLRTDEYESGVQTILTEPSSENLCIRSQEFDTWTLTSVTVTANAKMAPDATTTMDLLTAAGAGSNEFVLRSVAFTGDGTKCVSVFLDAGTSGTTDVALFDQTASTSRHRVRVTWTDGVPSAATAAGAGTIYRLREVSEGWRLEFSATGVVAANTNQIRIWPSGSGNTANVSVYSWGAMAENRPIPTSYIPTGAATVTRNADLAYLLDARLDPPRAMTVYIRSRNVGAYVNTGATRRVFNVGTNDVTTDARLSGGGGSAGATSVFGQHDNASTEVTATATAGSSPAALGTEVEQRIVLNADGSVISGVSVSRGAEATATSGAATLAANWAAPRLYLSGGLTADNAPVAYERILIVEGVRTMADMRQMAGG